MKKKVLSLVLAAGMMGSMFAPATASAALEDYEIVTTAEDNKVIFDCDMLYYSDDMYCMSILAQADAAGWIDLLGVTSDGGNTLCAPGTNAILRQLEMIERTDIPVYIGTDVPIMGFRDLAQDKPVTGGFTWTGGYRSLENYVEPQNYHDLGALLDEKYGYSTTEAQTDMNAAEFMIKSVKENPGQVTIFAVGACTNVALACMMDPTFAENTAGIVYMGGAIDVPGNANACGEFNWFYDPESVQICLNNDFPYQIVVPHDIAPKVLLAKDVIDWIKEYDQGSPVAKAFIENVGPKYDENPTSTGYCWDAITAGIFLCPDLITETEFRDLAIDCNRSSYSYANAVTWATDNGPYESKNVQIVFNIDRDAFWQFVAQLYGTKF